MSRRFTMAIGSLLLGVGVFLGLRLALDAGSGPPVGVRPSVKHIGIPKEATIADLSVPGSPRGAVAVSQGKPASKMKQYTSAGPPPVTTEEEESEFKWLRETADEQELRRELEELQETLLKESREGVLSRLAEGEYEPLEASADGTGGVVRPDPSRRHLLDLYSFDTEGKPVRVTLPESEFPDLHKTKRKMDWLEDLIRGP